jgi:hypothetical protein
MGAPTSAVLAETFIQYLEHTTISKILNKYKIIDYYRYVDDTLTTYDAQKSNTEHTLNEFNTVHPKIKFTIEKETQNQINYLDSTIRIYRKPTTTHLIIPSTSCHPQEHKKSAINYLVNMMNTYPLSQENKAQERNVIQILKKQWISTKNHLSQTPAKSHQYTF